MLKACLATYIMSDVTYQVTTCIGTGTQRTTGVKASKLGLASIRSSPAVKVTSVKLINATADSSCTSLPLNPIEVPIEVPNRTMAATLNPGSMVGIGWDRSHHCRSDLLQG